MRFWALQKREKMGFCVFLLAQAQAIICFPLYFIFLYIYIFIYLYIVFYYARKDAGGKPAWMQNWRDETDLGFQAERLAMIVLERGFDGLFFCKTSYVKAGWFFLRKTWSFKERGWQCLETGFIFIFYQASYVQAGWIFLSLKERGWQCLERGFIFFNQASYVVKASWVFLRKTWSFKGRGWQCLERETKPAMSKLAAQQAWQDQTWQQQRWQGWCVWTIWPVILNCDTELELWVWLWHLLRNPNLWNC